MDAKNLINLSILCYWLSFGVFTSFWYFGFSERRTRSFILLVGVALQMVSLLMRGMAIEYFPLTNKFESFYAFSCTAFLVLLWNGGVENALYRMVHFAVGYGFLVAAAFWPKGLSYPPPLMLTIWYVLHVPLSFMCYALWTSSLAAGVAYFLSRPGQVSATSGVRWPSEESKPFASPRSTLTSPWMGEGKGGGEPPPLTPPTRASLAPAERRKARGGENPGALPSGLAPEVGGRDLYHNGAGRADMIDLIDKGFLYGLLGFSISMLFGGLWGYVAWGSYFLWDAKVVWSVIIWLFYSTCIHVDHWPALRGYKPHLAVAGFLIMMVTYVGTSFFVSSSHRF